MLNYIWLALIVIGILVAAGKDFTSPPEPAGGTAFPNLTKVTNDGIVGSAKTAVTLAIGLIGFMALWLGVMKAEEAGLLQILTRLLTPDTRRLFPDIPSNHPAVGAMSSDRCLYMMQDDRSEITFLRICYIRSCDDEHPARGIGERFSCTPRVRIRRLRSRV